MGQPKQKTYIHPVPCGYLHQHHTTAPLLQQLPPAQTAARGEHAISLRWMESSAIYLRSEEGGELLSVMVISSFIVSAGTSTYLGLSEWSIALASTMAWCA